MRTLIAAAVLFAATSASAGLFECSYTAQRNAAISAAGATKIVVVGRAGSLRVAGGAGSDVRATGTACASESDFLQRIRLTATRSGSVVQVEAEIPEWHGFGFHEARLDYEVALPDGIALEVRDGSGELRIENVGPLQVEDSSGELQVRGVHGDLSVHDSSGSMHIDDVAGNVRIVDGSGGIDVAKVAGNVVIAEDGSGSIDIHDVRRNVTIEDDGSGSVEVTDVGGDFTVGSKGSGGISTERVAGRVRLPRSH